MSVARLRGVHASGASWFARTALVVIAAGICAAAGASPAAATGTKPVISGLTATPASVPSGGATTVTASVSGATSCTLSSNKAVAGLPATFACEGGPVEQGVAMPVNMKTKAAKYKLTLTASSPSGRAAAKVTVYVAIGAVGAGGFQGLAAGAYQACALLSGGTIDCWGANEHGQLGDGTHTGPQACYVGPCSTVPVAVSGISEATQVASGDEHSCALLAGGHVDCWGDNTYGQLGNGATVESDVPVAVTGISEATQVAAGGQDSCALLSSGHVECWGLASQGELGNGSYFPVQSDVPVEVRHIKDATQVSVGEDHACALLADGDVQCWGDNQDGELGLGNTTEEDVPKTVTGTAYASQVSAAGSQSCALHPGGNADCWGFDKQGELGDGMAGGISDVPVEVSGLTGATQVAEGDDNGCALLTGGSIECWGWNTAGELGNGSAVELSDIPVAVSGIASAEEVASGGDFQCALLSSGHIECWGLDQRGELGNGTSAEHGFSTPVEVQGIADAAR
jgi:alpha-tubulin suppressor-like RCC1 family protein